jgi:hypothetical protein
MAIYMAIVMYVCIYFAGMLVSNLQKLFQGTMEQSHYALSATVCTLRGKKQQQAKTKFNSEAEVVMEQKLDMRRPASSLCKWTSFVADWPLRLTQLRCNNGDV